MQKAYQPYKPTQEDVDWSMNLVGMMNNGGMMVCPATWMIYRFDKARHTLTLTNPDQIDIAMHERCKAVFARINWTVLP